MSKTNTFELDIHGLPCGGTTTIRESDENSQLGLGINWDQVSVSDPAVIFDGRVYHMCYAGRDDGGRRIGYADADHALKRPGRKACRLPPPRTLARGSSSIHSAIRSTVAASP